MDGAVEKGSSLGLETLEGLVCPYDRAKPTGVLLEVCEAWPTDDGGDDQLMVGRDGAVQLRDIDLR